MGLEPLRLVTIHPVLVHVTIGVIPFVVVFYAIAAFRQSDHWSFTADVTLALLTATTAGTLTFGVISSWMLSWPGGLSFWRWLHLAAGATSFAFLVVLTAARFRRRVRATWSTVGSAFGVALVVGFTGWIGGEVLVYHGGMAVKGAAEGALAPPIGRDRKIPFNLLDAMDRIRPAWAVVALDLNRIVIERPSARWFDEIREAGERMGATAATVGAAAHDRAIGGGPPEGEATIDVGTVKAMNKLAELSFDLSSAAKQHDLDGVIEAADNVLRHCARCHDGFRWTNGTN